MNSPIWISCDWILSSLTMCHLLFTMFTMALICGLFSDWSAFILPVLHWRLWGPASWRAPQPSTGRFHLPSDFQPLFCDFFWQLEVATDNRQNKCFQTSGETMVPALLFLAPFYSPEARMSVAGSFAIAPPSLNHSHRPFRETFHLSSQVDRKLRHCQIHVSLPSDSLGTLGEPLLIFCGFPFLFGPTSFFHWNSNTLVSSWEKVPRQSHGTWKPYHQLRGFIPQNKCVNWGSSQVWMDNEKYGVVPTLKSSKIRPFKYWNLWWLGTFWGSPILRNPHIGTNQPASQRRRTSGSFKSFSAASPETSVAAMAPLQPSVGFSEQTYVKNIYNNRNELGWLVVSIPSQNMSQLELWLFVWDGNNTWKGGKCEGFRVWGVVAQCHCTSTVIVSLPIYINLRQINWFLMNMGNPYLPQNSSKCSSCFWCQSSKQYSYVRRIGSLPKSSLPRWQATHDMLFLGVSATGKFLRTAMNCHIPQICGRYTSHLNQDISGFSESWYIMLANMVANLINFTLWMAKSIGPKKKTSQHNVAGAPADAPAAPAAVALARSHCMRGLGPSEIPRGCQEQKWSHPIPAFKKRSENCV